MKLLARLLITALALLLVAEVVPGIEVQNLYIAIIAALVLGLLNIFIKPLLVLLTLPITIITLGLFMFVINAALFWFTASFIDGFSVSGFLPALVGSLVVTVISAFANKLLE